MKKLMILLGLLLVGAAVVTIRSRSTGGDPIPESWSDAAKGARSKVSDSIKGAVSAVADKATEAAGVIEEKAGTQATR